MAFRVSRRRSMRAWQPSCPLSRIWPGRPYGATPDDPHRGVRAAGGGGVGAEDIREVLEELTRARPVFTEGGPYLALALPWRLPEAV